jgi:dTMP kinase
MAQAVPARGVFVTFEGGEGSGKSTQIKRLAERLAQDGREVVLTREPGGSPGAEILRHVILSGVGKMFGANTETLLFAAARDDHVESVIKPALAQGRWVLCDRFFDSTRAYQGQLGQVEPRYMDALQRVTIGQLQPDITFILDVPVEVGMHRAALRRGDAVPDRFEAESVSFHQGLREAYHAIARAQPQRCMLIAADRTPDEVAASIWDALQSRLASRASERLSA